MRRLIQKCRIGLLVLGVAVAGGLFYRVVSHTVAAQTSGRAELARALEQLSGYSSSVKQFTDRVGELIPDAMEEHNTERVRSRVQQLKAELDSSSLPEQLDRLQEMANTRYEEATGSVELAWGSIYNACVALSSSFRPLGMALLRLEQGDVHNAFDSYIDAVAYSQYSPLVESLVLIGVKAGVF